MTHIGASILGCNFAKLGEEISAVEKSGIDSIHIDVMDGHFVPNISIGIPIVKAVRKITKLPLDCHLMISEPEKYIESFADAGADWISVHVETCDPKKLLPQIAKSGCKAGLVINPPTPIKDILPYIDLADFILVMSVNPGFAGQKVLLECFDKLKVLRKALSENKNNKTQLQIDGGITKDNSDAARNAGADMLVAASAIFNSDDYTQAIDQLRGK